MSTKHRIFTTSFARVYPLYVAKAGRKGRTKSEVDAIICWLTGYTQRELDGQLKRQADFETFFAEAPKLNPSRSLIKGVVCGVRVEDVEDPLMREIRYLDKLVDELAKGKAMDRILRTPAGAAQATAPAGVPKGREGGPRGSKMESPTVSGPDDYAAAFDGWRRKRVEDLRATVRSVRGLEETIKWGHLVFSANGPVLLIRAEAQRVLFGFWRGQRLRDIEPRLKPGGKYEMATLELRESDVIDPKAVRRLVLEAVALNQKLGDPTAIVKKR